MPNLITKSIEHRTVNGDVMVKRMDRLGLTQRELAVLVGCSQGYICQLARPGKYEVKSAFAEKLREILK